MSFIYLAQPYSHKDGQVQAARFKIAEYMFAHYSDLGEIIYAPIVSCHRVSQLYNLPTTADFWEKQNTAFLEKAEAIRVLEMPGWEKSKGLAYEMMWWQSNRPYVPIQLVSWKEIVQTCKIHTDTDGTQPLHYWLDRAGAVL